jgi:hypothetical protein
MDVVAGQVQGDQALEDHDPSRESGAKEDQEAARGAPVDLAGQQTPVFGSSKEATYDHVEASSEARGLLKQSGGVSVQRIQKTRHAVET